MNTLVILLLISINACLIEARNNKSSNNKKECKCVPYYECNAESELDANGQDVIDVRGIDAERPECPDIQFCCYPEEIKSTLTVQKNQGNVSVLLGSKKFPKKKLNDSCGFRNLKSVLTSHEDLISAYNFPWSVAVFYRSLFEDSEKICVGSLIHKQVVLTTARCVLGKEKYLTIRAGKWNSISTETVYFQYRRISNVSIHPDYTNKSYVNDIALLKFETPIEVSDNVNTVCLPKESKYFDYNNCVTPGYIKNTSDPADKSKFQLIGSSLIYPVYCQNALKHSDLGQYFPFYNDLMCSKKNGNSDVCVIDNGSPLVCPMITDSTRYVQVGMLIWDVQCELQEITGIYVDIIKNRRWIKDSLKAYNATEVNDFQSSQHTPLIQSNDPKKNIFYYYYEAEGEKSGRQQSQSNTNFDALEKHYPNIYTQQFIKLALNPKYESPELNPNIQY